MSESQPIPRAFVSYKSANKAFAKQLATDLRRVGIFSWLDDWNLPPGKPLTDAMEEGILRSDVMLLLLSRDSVSSIHSGTGGVTFEVHIGEGRKFHDSDFRIIGVYLEDCSPPEKLKNRIGKWIDFSDPESYAAKLAELAAWIKNPEADLGPPVGSPSPPAEFRKLVRVSPDGRLIATSNLDGAINIIDNETKSLIVTLIAGKPPVNDMNFSPDGRTLFATDEERTYEWRLDAGVLTSKLDV